MFYDKPVNMHFLFVATQPHDQETVTQFQPAEWNKPLHLANILNGRSL
jgi:hypothetical protein